MIDTVHEAYEYSFFDKVKNSAASFVTLSPALLLAFLAIRVMELFHMSMANDLSRDFRTVAEQALLSDSMTLVAMLPFLFIPFFLVYLITATMRPRYCAYGIGGSIVVFSYVLLVKYFTTTLVPLGSDLFGYSFNDIVITVKGGTKLDAFTLVLVVLPLVLFWASLAFLSSRRPIKPFFALMILGAGIAEIGRAHV
jgi:uncharacterized sulfatase